MQENGNPDFPDALYYAVVQLVRDCDQTVRACIESSATEDERDWRAPMKLLSVIHDAAADCMEAIGVCEDAFFDAIEAKRCPDTLPEDWA